MEKQKKTALLIMEPPLANTGFGTVSRGIIPALASEYECYLLAAGGYGKLDNAELNAFGIKGYQPTFPDNLHLTTAVDQMCTQLNPDVVVSYYDVGTVYNYIEHSHLPFRAHVSYLITESEPLMPSWRRLFKDVVYEAGQHNLDFTINEIVLPSPYAQKVAQDETGRECAVGYHGSDHANWRKLSPEFKKLQRRQLGNILNWPDFEDAFIMMYVARNADRKMWPRMLQAMARAKQMAPEINFKLFAYTKKFDMFRQEGWMIENLVQQFGLTNTDVFYPQIEDIGGTPFESDVNSDLPSMLKHYNIADLYVHPSGVEGCGLPILEAARCGLPVLTTKFGGGWDYAKEFAMPINVSDFYYHKSGIAHAMIDVEDCAQKIVDFARNKKLLQQYSDLSLRRCNYKWDQLGKVMLAATNRAYEAARQRLTLAA